MKLARDRWAGALVLALAAFLAGCSPSQTGGSGGNASAPPAGNAATPATGGADMSTPLRVALVLDTGGVDDKSFNAAAHEGMMRAKKDFNVDDHMVESKVDADFKTNLSQFASQGFDLVFAVGYKMQSALEEIAPQFPEVKFAIVDGEWPEGQPNVAALKFKEEQGAFLAGFLAALMSKTKTIGFVGGEEIPLIKKFEAGYRAGAKAADPGVKVLATYTGDWNDINKGKSQAQQQVGNGADIIFAAAGKSGLGVIQTMKEKGPGFYAIGVDRDQDDEAKGRVLTSMVKKVDNAVYDTIKRVRAGKFASGPQMYDIQTGGIGLSEMRFTKQDIPADVMAKLEKVTQMVESGQIVPPTTVEEVETFAPPALP